MAPPGLRFGTDSEPGFRRRRAGRGVVYLDASGQPAASAERARIDALVLPPAWTDVWIAADRRSHLQATGRDARSRKQYRYHDDFRAHAESHKFAELTDWSEGLPSLRGAVARDLARNRLDSAKVVAVVVRLLDETCIRVGNEEYARLNGTFGLTTLRTSHVSLSASTLRFSFLGKSGKEHDVICTDRRVAGIVRSMVDLPGEHLFTYRSGDGVAAVHSSDVNTYLARNGGSGHTAKTFRTWHASVLAASLLARGDAAIAAQTAPARARAVAGVMRDVAKLLGNTAAVARRSYVHPGILRAFDGGELAARWRRSAGATRWLTEDEVRTARLLQVLGGDEGRW